jgi:hypothetical protein
VRALVHKAFISIVLHAYVLLLEVRGFLLQTAIAKGVQWQAVQILHVYEDDYHHAALGIRRAYNGQSQVVVVRAHVGVRVAGVEGH